LSFSRNHSWLEPSVQTTPTVQMSALCHDGCRDGF
jgi:hypothetical protein